MAACSYYLSSSPAALPGGGSTGLVTQYASPSGGDHISSSEDRRGSSNGQFIREEIVFGTPRCSTPATASNTVLSRSCTTDHTSSVSTSPADRRASMLQEYFKSTNALTRSIMLEKSTVENSHGHSWTVLSDSKRDEMLNDHFVPAQVRDQYGESGLQPRRHQSLNRMTSTPVFLSQDHHYESIDDIDTGLSTLSQPADSRFLTTPSLHSQKRRGSQPNITSENNFSRNKLMSFSMRSKKVSPINKRKMEPASEFLPLFEREVHDIDNEVDLPDESLLNDHVDTPRTNNEETFTRLRPLRYSFGRKLRHKTDNGTSQSSTDLTIISNLNTESPSLQDLHHMGSSSLDLTDLRSSPDYSQHTNDPHALLSSPMSDDNTSIVSTSRHSLTTPDPSHFTRGKSARFNLTEPPSVGFKHPLTRSVRAGSTYVTVTSDMADRRHLFKSQQMKRKVKSENNTRENTPVPSDIVDTKTTVPTIKGEESTVTGTELVSPMCSPPASPAAHGPPCSKRESGYISSYGENEASDDEEMPSRHNRIHKSKKRNNFLPNTSSNNTRQQHTTRQHYFH